jgi:hypothetical protein
MDNEQAVEIEESPEKPSCPMIEERRMGIFRLDRQLLYNCSQDDLLNFASNFLIVRAEYMLAMEAIEYVAYSPLFEPTDPACMPPSYMIQMDDDGHIQALKGYRVEKQ